jgi:hypothetical protein
MFGVDYVQNRSDTVLTLGFKLDSRPPARVSKRLTARFSYCAKERVLSSVFTRESTPISPDVCRIGLIEVCPFRGCGFPSTPAIIAGPAMQTLHFSVFSSSYRGLCPQRRSVFRVDRLENQRQQVSGSWVWNQF